MEFPRFVRDKIWGLDKPTYLMDENVKMSVDDIQRMKECVIINSTDKFPKGTTDDILTDASKENNWVIVTKDIRMALRSLEDGVSVIYVSDEHGTISYLNVSIYKSEYYSEMFEYLKKRFEYK